jgi:integrase
MRLKLTDIAIQRLKFQHPQVTYWDSLLPAFGVRVGSRSKTFIVMHGPARKRQTIGRYPILRLHEAREKARLFLGGSNRASPAIAFSDAVAEYLRSISTRPRTAYEYERVLKRHFSPTLGHRPIDELVSRDILAITDRLLHTPTECRHAHVAVQTFFNWCVPRYLPANPMVGLKTPTKPNTRARILTTTELKAVWTAAEHLGDFGKLVRLCILTGQRRGEIAVMRPDWIRDAVLTIPATVAKNNREHSIPLLPHARALSLQAPFKVGNWGRKKNELDELSGVIGWVLHDLRRTFSTMLAGLKIAPHVIEKMLNHVSGKDALSPLAAIYNRETYLNEMREALTTYDAYLTTTVLR